MSSPDNVAVAYEYDSRGRKAAETRRIEGASYRVDYGYNEQGGLAKILYPQTGEDRYWVEYGYSDVTGYLQNVIDGMGVVPLWEVKSRNLDGRVTREAFGDYDTCEHQYLPRTGLPWTEFCLSGAGVPTVSMYFIHDKRGYLSSRDGYLGFDPGTGQPLSVHETFTHDELGRLTHWASAAGDANGEWSVHYDYDDIGNIQKRTKTAGGNREETTYTSGPSGDRWGGPHAVTLSLTSTVVSQTFIPEIFNYDGAGRQTGATLLSGVRSVTFTDFDLPTYISVDGGAVAYLYDAHHQRAKKSSTDGHSIVYVGKLYEKRTVPGQSDQVVMYVLGEDGSVIAQRTTSADVGTSILDYIRYDQLGSVVETRGTDGSRKQVRFDPFGSRIAPDGPPGRARNPNPRVSLGFTGQEMEDEIGLINMNGRIYDPHVMRFLSADPIVSQPGNSQWYNRYSYVGNSPFRWTDPSGFAPGCDFGSAFGCNPGPGPGGDGWTGGGRFIWRWWRARWEFRRRW
jgi:RHS repeat-associated protein